MSFAQVLFLLGAVGVLGPILAHLLARPRFRRVPFTMMRFLQSGKRDTQAKSRLRNLLLLLLRAAMIVLLAMMFAGPRLVSQADPSAVTPLFHIGVDDSISMTYRDGGTTVFEKMQTRAAELVTSAPADTLFCLTALASDAQVKDATRDEALAFLKRLKPVPARARLESFFGELRNAERRRNGSHELSAAIVSDFSSSMVDELAKLDDALTVDRTMHVSVAPSGPVSNAAVTAATVTGSTADTVELTATVANYGSDTISRAVKAVVDEATVAQTDVTLASGETRRIVLDAPLDAVQGDAGRSIDIVLVDGEDNLSADNTFRLVVTVPAGARRSVAIFGRDAREAFLVKTALDTVASESTFGGVTVTQVLYDAFTPGQLKISDAALFASVTPVVAGAAAEIEAFIRAGGRAVFFVSPASDASALEKLFAAGVLPAMPRKPVEGAPAIDAASIVTDASGMDADAESAAAFSGYRPGNILLTGAFECEPSPESACLWTLKGGAGFLYYKRLGGGVTVLVNTSADDSLGTLARSPGIIAFLKFLLGRTSAPTSKSFTCGESVVFPAVTAEIDAAGMERPVWVRKPDGTTAEAALSGGMLAVACADQFGWVTTLAEPVRRAGVNLPPGETNVAAVDPKIVDDALAKVFIETAPSATAEAGTQDRRLFHPIWRWFAWGLLALVLLEAFVSNRTKR